MFMLPLTFKATNYLLRYFNFKITKGLKLIYLKLVQIWNSHWHWFATKTDIQVCYGWNLLEDCSCALSEHRGVGTSRRRFVSIKIIKYKCSLHQFKLHPGLNLHGLCHTNKLRRLLTWINTNIFSQWDSKKSNLRTIT